MWIGFVLIFWKANFSCTFNIVHTIREIHILNIYLAFLIFIIQLKTMLLMHIFIYVLHILKTKYKKRKIF